MELLHVEVETHNFKGLVSMTLQWRCGQTYRLCGVKHGDVYPDEEQHGDVPIPRQRQARYSLKPSKCHTATNSTNTV